jgi:hypothetical protein
LADGPVNGAGALVAGFGSAVITPELPVMLAGFGDRTEPATEVHDDLEVRALYLGDENGTPRLCLLVCDLLGLSPAYATPARQAVAGDLELRQEAVLTASTHTHSGPSCIAGSEAVGWPIPPGYREVLVAGCRAAAAHARFTAEPAALAFRRAALPDGLSVNRRGLPYRPWLALLDVLRRGETRGGAAETAGEPGRAGRIGLLANLAVHPVALGPECRAVSADWIRPFRAELEARLDGVAVMLSGALGDVNPRHVHRQSNRCSADGFAEAQELGRELAEVVAGEAGAAEALDGPVEVIRAEQLSVPVGSTMLAGLTRAEQLPVELVEWSVGGARLVSVPGEAFHAFGRAVEDARPGPVLIAGLAPVWFGYLPVPFREGYEESMSYGEPFVTALLAALATDSAHA